MTKIEALIAFRHEMINADRPDVLQSIMGFVLSDVPVPEYTLFDHFADVSFTEEIGLKDMDVSADDRLHNINCFIKHAGG